VEMPTAGDELHHFGWNACSSALCPYAPHPHMERRYLVVPGLRSSRIHILDIKPNPRKPQIVRVIEPEESLPAFATPAPINSLRAEGIYISALGSLKATDRARIPVGPRLVRCLGPVGDGSWSTIPGLRFLVAPGP
jgi:selenium-binding protein 1